jgi:hypothetical protein
VCFPQRLHLSHNKYLLGNGYALFTVGDSSSGTATIVYDNQPAVSVDVFFAATSPVCGISSVAQQSGPDTQHTIVITLNGTSIFAPAGSAGTAFTFYEFQLSG